MKRIYLLAAVAIVTGLVIVSPVLGGPSLRKLVKKEVAKQLANKAGPQGATGPQGAPGPQGTPGADGSPAGSVLLGRLVGSTSLGSSANVTEYLSPSGVSASTSSVAPLASMPVPANGSAVIRDLTVVLSSGPTSGKTRTFTVMDNGAPTAVSCPISDLDETCDSGGSTAAIASGHQIAFRAQSDPVGVSAATNIQFSMRVTSP
jgi:hypothetical protein